MHFVEEKHKSSAFARLAWWTFFDSDWAFETILNRPNDYLLADIGVAGYEVIGPMKYFRAEIEKSRFQLEL
jgi:hypothetical protein